MLSARHLKFHNKGNLRKAADIFIAIINARIKQGKEGQLDELPGRQGHGFDIFIRNSQLNMVDLISGFKECSVLCCYAAGIAAFEP